MMRPGVDKGCAQWLELRTSDRGFLGSDPGRAASELWQFRLPDVTSVFRRRHYKLLVPSIWSHSGVYARESKISHTGGKCVTCRRLHKFEIKPTNC